MVIRSKINLNYKFMNQEQINEQIFNRLRKLEETVFNYAEKLTTRSKKIKTLSELIFGKKFNNGQEKIAVIVGYLEKIEHKTNIKEEDIKQGWKSGKFEGYYANSLLQRATKNLVRDLRNDTYDLT